MHELSGEGWIAGSHSTAFVQMIKSGLPLNVDALRLLQENWENCVRPFCIILQKQTLCKRMQQKVAKLPPSRSPNSLGTIN